jgi:hypothetical protein
MAKYIVTGPKATFGAGFVLGLSDKQIQTRRHLLKKEGKYYRALEDVQFKNGEVVDIVSQNLSKSMLDCLEPFGKPSARGKPKDENPPEKTELDNSPADDGEDEDEPSDPEVPGDPETEQEDEEENQGDNSSV